MPEEQLAEEQLAEKDKLIEEQKNKLLRSLADFDNYKKRTAIEQDSLIQYANENLILELLPAIDSFERALKMADKSEKDELLKGIALIKKQIEDSLKKFGIEEIQALGKLYDPTLHEAIMKKGSDKPEDTIIEEIQKGYTLRGKVIRPVMVIVSKGG